MKRFVQNWYNISVYIAAFVALAAIQWVDDALLKLQLAAVAFIFLHFFEEFGWPGGFPLMGVKVLMGSEEMDSTKWGANNLNSMCGNWFFAICVYILPICLPSVRFLVLAGMLFNFLEVFMHLILFNVKQKTLYNPGLITGLFGLGTIGSIYFFGGVFQASAFVWYDWVIAAVWMVAIFLISFRSKPYWNLGKKEGYPFTDMTAYGEGHIPEKK